MTQAAWDKSADAWIAGLGRSGDPTRVDILDAPMLAALPKQGEVLDVGCGEGRFCRLMQAQGLRTVGLDPTAALLAQANEKDAQGTYVEGRAEVLPFEDARFDAVVFYLSLIDITDFRVALAQAVRVLKPGGHLVIANLHAHATARPADLSAKESSWMARTNKPAVYVIDDMMEERGQEVAWSGLRIVNYHRPLSAYMQALLALDLELIAFQDPPYTGKNDGLATRYRRMPWAFQMVWKKKERPQ